MIDGEEDYYLKLPLKNLSEGITNFIFMIQLLHLGKKSTAINIRCGALEHNELNVLLGLVLVEQEKTPSFD